MNVKSFLEILKKKLYLVIILPIVFATGMALYSYCFVPNIYTSSVPLYIWQDETESISMDLNEYNTENSSLSSSDSSSTNSSSTNSNIDPELQARSELSGNLAFNNMIASDIQTYLKSNMINKAVIRELGLDSLKGYTITTDVDPKTPSRVMSIICTGQNPETVADIANCFARKTQEVTSKFWNVKAINILEDAEPATSPSGPQRKLYILVAGALGLCLALIYIAIRCYFDTTIKDKDQIEKLLKIPMLSDIPYVKGKI